MRAMAEAAGERCRAHSHRSGKPCRLYAIRGGSVCQVHGGSAPQVKRSAALRLALMVDPLLSELFRIAKSGENDAVRLAAIKDALDRAGVGKEKGIVGNGVTFTLRIDRGSSDDE